MKHFSILIALAALLTLPVSADAQSRLLRLTDTRTGKTELVKPGSVIFYQLENDSIVHEGKLEQLSVSAMEIDGKEISLSEVKVLGACPKGRIVAGSIAEGIGHGLTIAGQVVTYLGVEICAVGDLRVWLVGGTVTMAGGILWGTGFVIKALLTPVFYTLRDKELSRNLEADVVSRDKNLVYPDDIYD